jgi:hypothetical protein
MQNKSAANENQLVKKNLPIIGQITNSKIGRITNSKNKPIIIEAITKIGNPMTDDNMLDIVAVLRSFLQSIFGKYRLITQYSISIIGTISTINTGFLIINAGNITSA